MFFTILPKLAITNQKDALLSKLEVSQSSYCYKSLLLALNSNYVDSKASLIVSFENNANIDELNSLSNYTTYSSNQSLNL
jgi:hypothetical protein